MTQVSQSVNNDWIPEVEKAVDEFIALEIAAINKLTEQSKETVQPTDLPF